MNHEQNKIENCERLTYLKLRQRKKKGSNDRDYIIEPTNIVALKRPVGVFSRRLLHSHACRHIPPDRAGKACPKRPRLMTFFPGVTACMSCTVCVRQLSRQMICMHKPCAACNLAAGYHIAKLQKNRAVVRKLLRMQPLQLCHDPQHYALQDVPS